MAFDPNTFTYVKKETKMTQHNDTLTALHVKQGTKFCSIRFWDALHDAKKTDGARTKAVKGEHGTSSTYVYKHAMDLSRGDVVVLPSGTGIVTALDAAPTFGEGIDYKWVVARITNEVEAMHQTQERERKAVEAMAVNEAMSAADKVLMEAGIMDTSGVAGLLGGAARPSAPRVYGHDGGGMPESLGLDTLVGFKLRSGDVVEQRRAGTLRWVHTLDPADVIEWWYADS